MLVTKEKEFEFPIGQSINRCVPIPSDGTEKFWVKSQCDENYGLKSAWYTDQNCQSVRKTSDGRQYNYELKQKLLRGYRLDLLIVISGFHYISIND